MTTGWSNRTIGVLNLQGGVVEHLDHLSRLGLTPVTVKTPKDLQGLAGLIIPGGESTCLARLLHIFKMDEAILQAYKGGVKLWGTCAGAILLANELDGETAHLKLADVCIQRNAFGSQLRSFHELVEMPDVADELIPLTFIRAPKILKTGPQVKVLGRLNDYIIAAQTGDILLTVFHPELTPSLAFHRHFAHLCGLETTRDAQSSLIDPNWSPFSWTRQASGKQ